VTAIEEAQQQVSGVEGSEDWQVVATDDEGCYDWSAISVFWSPSARKYFWYQDSGCSCTDHMDYVTGIGDFEVGDKADVLRVTGNWSDRFFGEIRDHKGLRLN
jgi:hypothetical protein